jgi:hypothetical protein
VSQVAQYSVWLRAGRPGDQGLIPDRGEKIFPLACVQTGSGDHPASCTMGTGGPFPGLKRSRGVTLTAHPHIMPRSRMSSSFSLLSFVASIACSVQLYFTFIHTWSAFTPVSHVQLQSFVLAVNWKLRKLLDFRHVVSHSTKRSIAPTSHVPGLLLLIVENGKTMMFG